MMVDLLGLVVASGEPGDVVRLELIGLARRTSDWTAMSATNATSPIGVHADKATPS